MVERLDEWEASCKMDIDNPTSQQKENMSLNEQNSACEGEGEKSQQQTVPDPEENILKQRKEEVEEKKSVKLSKPRTLREAKEKFRLVYHDINFVSFFANFSDF